MLGKTREVGVRRRRDENRGVSRGDGASPFAFESAGNHRSPTASHSRANLLIHEVDELLRKAHRDLLAHPIMVAKRYRKRGSCRQRVRGHPLGRLARGCEGACTRRPERTVVVLSSQVCWRRSRDNRLHRRKPSNGRVAGLTSSRCCARQHDRDSATGHRHPLSSRRDAPPGHAARTHPDIRACRSSRARTRKA